LLAVRGLCGLSDARIRSAPAASSLPPRQIWDPVRRSKQGRLAGQGNSRKLWAIVPPGWHRCGRILTGQVSPPGRRRPGDVDGGVAFLRKWLWMSCRRRSRRERLGIGLCRDRGRYV